MRKKYNKPKLVVYLISQEESIAALSHSTVSFGDDDNPFRPSVEDWNESEWESGSFDL